MSQTGESGALRTSLLSIHNLDVRFGRDESQTIALDGVSLDIYPAEVFGLIGETGAGKSLTAWAALDLLPRGARLAGGEVWFDGRKLTGASPRTLREIRGSGIGVVVQNPLGALDPMKRIGDQIADVYRSHHHTSRRDARNRAINSLRDVGIGDPSQRARAYPHQLSGGMAQRVLIAMALVNGPRLIIADEPTTGLDVTLQAEILDLMTELVRDVGSAVWLITHDLGVIANYTERAAVMFAGEIVEVAPTRKLFEDPRHPYTIGLLDPQSETLGAARVDTGRAPPDLRHRPVGCQYQYRCSWAQKECELSRPMLVACDSNHPVRCFVAQATAGVEVSPEGHNADSLIREHSG